MYNFQAPPAERSTILGFSSAGSQIGNVITLPLGGYLCENGFDGGWASIFYVIGQFVVVTTLQKKEENILNFRKSRAN